VLFAELEDSCASLMRRRIGLSMNVGLRSAIVRRT
jgi:hypothetical protein